MGELTEIGRANASGRLGDLDDDAGSVATGRRNRRQSRGSSGQLKTTRDGAAPRAMKDEALRGAKGRV